jgi:hypothetical protein
MGGLNRSGRLARLGIQTSDLTSSLSRVTDLITRMGGNIVEVRSGGDGCLISEELANAEFSARILGDDCGSA